MKSLLYVTNSRFPSQRAHALQVVKMCNAFADIGLDVTLAVTNRPTDITEAPEAYYGENFNFSLVRVPVFNLATLAGKMPKVIRNVLYFIQRVSFVCNLSGVKQATFVYGRDPVILYLIGLRHGFQKLVYESHEAHYNFFVRSLSKRGVKIIVISEGIRDFYLEQGVDQKYILVAHDAIDDQFLDESISQSEARLKLNLPTNGKIAMYIGGFDAWKGVETFFAASNLLEECTFVAIGGQEEEIALLTAKYPHVNFLGYLPYRELVHNQRAADVLVVPNTAKNNLSARYTSPLKLFAHLASGVPLLVSNIPSMRAVVTEEQVYFFEPDNPSALADLIREILNDDTAQLKTVEAKELAKKYTWNERVRSIINSISQ